MTFENKLRDKCEALCHLLIGVQQFYLQTNSNNQRFIETTIGAAIWYMPKNRKILFTGKISKQALLLNERSEDHLYPRKIAARELLKLNFSCPETATKELMKRYCEKYGRYNYVSKSENKKLIKFQKSNVFVNPQQAYFEAGVELVEHP